MSERAGTAEPTAATGALAARLAGQAVMAECLRTVATGRARSPLARLLGSSPLDDQSRPWYVGALGEQEVGRRLAALGPGWTVLHALPVGDRGSDVDHVVIGPGGVFTLNTKHHAGQKMWVAGQTVMVAGQRQPYVRNAVHEAGRAAKLLSAAAGRPVAVTGAIVLVDPAGLTVREAHPEVAVVTAPRLVRWLTRMPAQLTPEQVRELSAAASRPSTWQRRPQPSEDGRAVAAGFAALHRDVVGARRVRGLWRFGLAAALVGALVVGGPVVLHEVGDAVVGGIVR